MPPKTQFSQPIFGHPGGSTKLDRPYCNGFNHSYGTHGALSLSLSISVRRLFQGEYA